MKNIELMREYMRLVEAGEKEPWKHFEVYLFTLNRWSLMGDYHWFSMGTYRFRLKQRTININGFEVPEPTNEALNIGDKYFIADPVRSTHYIRYVWQDDGSDQTFLKKGVIHLTKEDAIKHAKALLSFTVKGNERSK